MQRNIKQLLANNCLFFLVNTASCSSILTGFVLTYVQCILDYAKKYMANFEVGNGKWYNNPKYLKCSGNSLIFSLNF